MIGGNTKRVIIWLVICALGMQMIPVSIMGDTWVQTTQEDFEGGTTQNTNVTLSPGNVTLDLNPDWWNSSWKYRMPINITENSGDDLTDFQVPIEIDTKQLIVDGKMRSDLGDIRFTDQSGSQLPYWVEVLDNLDYDEPDDNVAYWNFDEGDGNTTLDVSGNGNHGIHYGNTRLLMHFDEGNGQVVNDESPYGNHGQLGNTTDPDIYDPMWNLSEGIFGDCLYFEDDDYVILGDRDSLDMGLMDFTLESWINTSIDPGVIATKYNDSGPNSGYQWEVDSNGRLRGFLQDSINSRYVISNELVNDGKWHHVVFAVDRDNPTGMKLFIDGSEATYFQQDDPMALGDLSNDRNFYIGVNDWGGILNIFFNGSIDEMAVYSKALSSEEISAHYNAQRAIFTDWTTGKFNSALEFDGVDDYIEIHTSDSLNITNKITIEAWIKTQKSSRIESIVSKGAYSLKIGSDGKPYLELCTGSETIVDVGQLGVNTGVNPLVVYDGKLYGGTYDSGKVYRYDEGTTWTDVGQLGANTAVISMAVYDGKLYGGTYDSGKVYRYDEGTTWTDVGQLGTNTHVFSLAVYNGKLYGGTDPSGKVYRYDGGTTWTDVGQIAGKEVRSLAVYDGKLYGGTNPAGKVYRYDGGTTWTDIGQLGTNTNVLSLAVYNSKLYGGIEFSGRVYRYDGGTTWTDVGQLGTNTIVYSLAVYDGKLYGGTDPSGRVYRYDGGTTWIDIGQLGTNDNVRSLVVYDGKLYGGTYSSARVYSIGDGLAIYSNNPLNNQFNHITGTYDGSIAKIFINDMIENSQTQSLTINTNSLSLLIGESYGSSQGGFSGSGDDNFNGTIDEVRIYDRALSAEEIRAIYHEKSRMWINVSSLPASQITTIYMYYGNPYVRSTNNFDATFTKDYGEEGLMGLWHMDEGFGLVTNDSSGNGNHGTLVNGPVWQSEDGGQWDGRSDVKFSTGSTLEFDGIDDHVIVSQDPSLIFGNNNFTIEIWVYSTALSEQRPILTTNAHSFDNDRIHIFINPESNQLGFDWREPDETLHPNGRSLSCWNIAPNNWYNVVVTRQGFNFSLFVNGILTDSEIDNNPIANGADWLIGRHNFLGGRSFQGLIDEIRIYNRSLNVEEIKTHYERRKYANPEPTYTFGLEKVGDWHLEGDWQYRKQITINNTANPDTLTDFQVLIKVNTSSLISAGKMRADCGDIRFIDSNGIPIPYWVESGINTNMTRIWVKVPTIPVIDEINIFIYYGNPYTDDMSDFDATFTKNYGEEGLVGLWHMDEGSGPTATDSSGNGNNGILTNGPIWQNEDGGQWDGMSDVKFSTGSALQFDGVDDYVEVDGIKTVADDPDDNWCISLWFKADTTSSSYIGSLMTFAKESGANEEVIFLGLADNKFRANIRDDGGTGHMKEFIFMDTDNWHYAVLSFDNDNDKGYLYFDNELKFDIDSSSQYPAYFVSIGTWRTAGHPNGHNFFNGTIDEVRIYNRSLSAEEIKAHYERRKYTSPEPTITIGAEEGRYKTPGSFISSIFNSSASGTIWNTISWTQTLPPGTDITIATRSGDVPNPGISWSNWSLELTNPIGSSIPSPRSRYIQYRVTLTTTNTSTTPVLHEVIIDYTLNVVNPPILDSPSDGNWTSNNIPTFIWNFSDPNLDSQIQYYIEIDDDQLFGSVDYTNVSITSLEYWDSIIPIADGTWYWRVRTMDEYGLWSDWSENWSINIDTTAPIAPTDVAAEPDTWTNINTFTVNWTNPFDFSGVKLGGWYKIGSPPTSNSDGTWLDSKPLTVTSLEGQQTIYIWLEDNLGNVDYQNNASTILYLDTTPPSAPINLGAVPDSWTGSNSFSINWTNPLDDSGVEVGAWYKIGAPPTSNLDGIWNDIKPFAVTSLEGQQSIYVWLEDNVGNVDYLNNATVTLYLDTTPPKAFSPTADPSGWTSNNQPQITFSTTDSASGISHYEVQIDSGSFTTQTSPYTLPSQTDGIHMVTVRAHDNVGNYRESSVEVYIDTTPPEPFTPTADPNVWTSNNQPQVIFSTTDATSGISHYEVQIDSGTFISQDSPYTLFAQTDGTHVITIRAYDNAGNYREGIVEIYIDTTSPLAPSEIGATPNSWTKTNSFLINWTNPIETDTSGIKNGCWYKIGSPPTSNTDGTWIGEKPITVTSQEGEQTIYIWLEDNLGNVDYNNYGTTTLYLDTTPPGPPTDVTASPSSWTISNSFNIDWINPFDDSGVKTGAWYKIGSPPTSDEDGIWLGEKPITVSTSEGETVIYIWLEDNLENRDYNNYGSTNLYLDRIAPSITHVPVTHAKKGEVITISATVIDNVTVKTVTLHYRKQGDENFENIIMSQDGDGYSADIPSSFVTKQKIEYYISASDEINTATYPSSGATTEYLPIVVDEEDFLTTFWWLLLLLFIVVVLIVFLLSRRREQEVEIGAIPGEETTAVEPEETISEEIPEEEPQPEEPGEVIDQPETDLPEEEPEPTKAREELGTAPKPVPPLTDTHISDDEIFDSIKKKFEEGKISEETFEDFKKRYKKE